MKRHKILFILPGFHFGGTVFSTLNMILFLRGDYDIQVLPMNPYGPVRERYEEAGIILLTPTSALMAVSFTSIAKENSVVRKCGILRHKAINHLCIHLHIDYTSIIYNKVAGQITRQYHPDYVCSTQEASPTELASFFSQTKRIAWFRNEYSLWKEQQYSPSEDHCRRLYLRFDRIVLVSRTTADDFLLYFPDLTHRVIAIHNIQKDENIIQQAKAPVPDAFPQTAFNIVTVGRIAKQKQIHLIPGIAHRLKNEYGLDFRWYIIGDGDLEGERARLDAAFEQYQNRDYVICLGSRLNPYPYIATADLLVNTSRYEACPRVVAEAKILHTPVVCTDFSSAREFVTDGYDGFVDTPENLPAIISRLISDKELYARIKANSNRYRIDNETIYQQLQELFA